MPVPCTSTFCVDAVKLVKVAAPKVGVVSDGDVANTAFPVPVDVVNADSRFALEGVARNVATPVPNPLTPVLMGNPVAFVSVPEAGVPSTGAVNVGAVSVLFVKV